MYSNYNGLKYKGKLGKLLYDLMTEDFHKKNLIMFGISGKHISNEFTAVYINLPKIEGEGNTWSWLKDEGFNVDHIISLPMGSKDNIFKQQLFNHETTHYYIYTVKKTETSAFTIAHYSGTK